MKTQKVLRSLAIAGAMLLIAFANSFTLQKKDTSLDYIKANITDEYPSVIIGTQEWMTENLNVDVFRNGDPIPEAISILEWKEAGDARMPAWCYYNNDPANGGIYGKLYNWYAVNDPRGLAPEGWHVPSEMEWRILTKYLGEEETRNIREDLPIWYTAKAGGKMKSAGTQYWRSPNEEATNSSGFSGLPGGTREHFVNFTTIGDIGNYWSSSDYDILNAWYRFLVFSSGEVMRSYAAKSGGASVRCIKD